MMVAIAREPQDPGAQRLTAIELPGHVGVLATGHIPQGPIAPVDPNGIGVMLVSGFPHEAEVVALAQVVPHRLGVVVT